MISKYSVLHLLICTALRAHVVVAELLYKRNDYYYEVLYSLVRLGMVVHVLYTVLLLCTIYCSCVQWAALLYNVLFLCVPTVPLTW